MAFRNDEPLITQSRWTTGTVLPTYRISIVKLASLSEEELESEAKLCRLLNGLFVFASVGRVRVCR